MTKQEKLEYKDKKPIGSYCMSNWGGIEIMDIKQGIEDYVIWRFNFGEPQEVHKSKLHYGVRHTSFRTTAGYSIRLDDCMRV